MLSPSSAQRSDPPPSTTSTRLCPGPSNAWRKYEDKGYYPGLLLSLHQLCRQFAQSAVGRA